MFALDHPSRPPDQPLCRHLPPLPLGATLHWPREQVWVTLGGRVALARFARLGELRSETGGRQTETGDM